MISNKIAYSLLFIIISIFSITTIFVINDYGISLDSPVNLGIGHKYFYFYQTGHLNLNDDLPKIKNHPPKYNALGKKIPYMIFSFANILSAITCYIFHQKLNILDPISAHHIIIPILMIFFLFFFFLFLKNYFGNSIGIITLLVLITNPRFWGHIFYNIKDVPEIIFFSMTIFYFVDWLHKEKIRYLYLSFIFFGLALSTKMDALLIPPILLLWLSPTIYQNLVINKKIKFRTLIHFLFGTIVSIIFFIASFPAFLPWAYSSKKEFWDTVPMFFLNMIRYSIGLGSDITCSWNLYPIKQVFFTTPTPMLIFAIIGFLLVILQFKKKFNLLLISWLFFTLLRHCLPKVNHYDGLRHFLTFVIPFSIIIAIGINFISNKIDFLKIKKNIFLYAITILLISFNIYDIVITHPYQTTYYNNLIGGLEGAQKKDIPFSCDYWLSSIKQAIEWLNKNANENAFITSPLLNYYDNDTFYYYKLRKDLKIVDFVSSNPGFKNTYIINIPRRWNRLDWKKIQTIQKFFPKIKDFKTVHKITRQNGEIFTIYYNK